MKISVCIPTYNQADYLPLAVRSALSQKGMDIEVWVADDCSTDSTALVMQEFATDSRVHYHRHPTNLGIAENVGWLLSQSKTAFTVRLDSDDILLPDYCRILSEKLNVYPAAGVAHCAIAQINEEGSKTRIRRLARKSGFQSADQALWNAQFGYRVAANVCMFRTDALRAVNFTINRPNYTEDWDLFARLSDANFGNVYVSDVLAQYRVWTDGKGYRAGRKATEISGMIRLFEETLEPTWKRREWDLSSLSTARRNFAKTHTASLRDLPKNSIEFQEVESLLTRLGNGDPNLIRKQLEILSSPMNRIQRMTNAVRGTVRDVGKYFLFR
jgi:glycosyltransferase involved in cell wall biosynthesis